MAGSQTIRTVLRDPNYLALERHYLEHPIALYTGAGVSWAEDPQLGLRGWNDFVRQIMIEHDGPDSPALVEFDRRVQNEWADEPWRMADWVATRCGTEAFKRHIKALVQRKENFQGSYKLLSGHFISSAPTMNTISAFCATLTGIVEGTVYPTYRIGPNPRVRAVLTSNYDPFLEAASSTMFNYALLKPVGALGSQVGDLDQTPVYHIHGYVPFPNRKPNEPDRPIQSLVDPVLTSEDYERAWLRDDVYCPTMGPQIHVLRHYSVLFVGFSFRDYRVKWLLRDLNEERGTRESDRRLYHYALMKQDDVARRKEGFWEELGVKPIPLGSFGEIETILGHLYRQGLTRDWKEKWIELPIVEKGTGNLTGQHGYLSPHETWRILFACRNRSVRKTHRDPQEVT